MVQLQQVARTVFSSCSIKGIQSMFYGGATSGIFSILQSCAMSGPGCAAAFSALGATFGKLFEWGSQEEFDSMSPEWHDCMVKVIFDIIQCYADENSTKYCDSKFDPAWSRMLSYKDNPVGKFRCPRL